MGSASAPGGGLLGTRRGGCLARARALALAGFLKLEMQSPGPAAARAPRADGPEAARTNPRTHARAPAHATGCPSPTTDFVLDTVAKTCRKKCTDPNCLECSVFGNCFICTAGLIYDYNLGCGEYFRAREGAFAAAVCACVLLRGTCVARHGGAACVCARPKVQTQPGAGSAGGPQPETTKHPDVTHLRSYRQPARPVLAPSGSGALLFWDVPRLGGKDVVRTRACSERAQQRARPAATAPLAQPASCLKSTAALTGSAAGAAPRTQRHTRARARATHPVRFPAPPKRAPRNAARAATTRAPSAPGPQPPTAPSVYRGPLGSWSSTVPAPTNQRGSATTVSVICAPDGAERRGFGDTQGAPRWAAPAVAAAAGRCGARAARVPRVATSPLCLRPHPSPPDRGAAARALLSICARQTSRMQRSARAGRSATRRTKCATRPATRCATPARGLTRTSARPAPRRC